MNRVLCFGGRNYADAAKVHEVLWFLATAWQAPFVVINGGARGADTLCKEWGLKHGYPTITMDAPWTAMGRSAGSIRNGWMIEFALPNYAVGFPGGTGTADMTKRLKRAGIPVWLPLCTN